VSAALNLLFAILASNDAGNFALKALTEQKNLWSY